MEGSTVIIAGFGPGQVGEAGGPIEGLGEGLEPEVFGGEGGLRFRFGGFDGGGVLCGCGCRR
jgi:hypothetical protein